MSPCRGHRAPWLLGESSKAGGAVRGRRGRGQPGSVCLSCLLSPPQPSPEPLSEKAAEPRWEGGGSAQLVLPLPWARQAIVAAVADGDGLQTRRCVGVAPTQSGITFHLRKAARLHSRPCAPERKGMAIMGQAGNGCTPRVHPREPGCTPTAQGEPRCSHPSSGKTQGRGFGQDRAAAQEPWLQGCSVLAVTGRTWSSRRWL